MKTTLIAALLGALLAGAHAAADAASSPVPHMSPVPAPMQSSGIDPGRKTSGIGTTEPVAQPSGGRVVDPLAPDRPDEAKPDTPGKTGLGVTDRVPLGHPADGPGSKTDGIGSPPNAGAGAR